MEVISRRELIQGLAGTLAMITLNGPAECLAADGRSANDPSALIEVFSDETVQWWGEEQLARPDSALFELYRMHGLNVGFSTRPGYGESRQCEDNFRGFEQEFRLNDAVYFTNVQRSKINSDVAYMLGMTKTTPYSASSVYGSTQFQDGPAIRMVGEVPGIVLAGAHIYKDAYRASSKDLAESTALTNVVAEPITGPRGRTRRLTYYTPQTEVVYYPPEASVNRRYNAGMAGVRRRETREPLKVRGLYYM